MSEPEFFLSSSQKALELGVSQEGDWDDVSGSVLAHVHGEVALGDVHRQAVFVTVAVFLA